MNGKGLLALKASGPLNDSGALAFEGKLTLIDADIDYRNFRKPTKKVNGTFQFTPDTITITDVTGWWANSPFTCLGEIKDYRSAEKSKIYVHVASENADINDLASAFFPWKGVQGKGLVKIFIDFNCLGYRSQNLRFKGQSQFHDLTLVFPALPNPFNNLQGKVGFSSDGLSFQRIKGETGSSDISFSGLWKNLSQPKISGNFGGNVVNFSDFYKPAEKEEEKKPFNFTLEKVFLSVKEGRYKDLFLEDIETEIGFRDGVLNVLSLKSQKGKFREFDFSGLNTIQENQPVKITYHDGVITIPFLCLESKGGKWVGKDIRLPIGAKEEEVFSLTSEMTGISMAEFLEGFPSDQRKITGSLNMNGKISGTGKTISDCLKTLNGEAALIMEDGVLKKGPILSKLFFVLNVSRIFSLDYRKLLINGLPYESIQGNFQIQNGVAKTDSLYLDSPSMRMDLVGDIDLGNQTVNMEIAVQPLETVDKVIGRIPIVGTILKGDQGAIVVMYYKLTGPFENTKLNQVVFQSLGRKGQGMFKQIFKLPETIFNWNGKNKSENKNQDSGDKKE